MARLLPIGVEREEEVRVEPARLRARGDDATERHQVVRGKSPTSRREDLAEIARRADAGAGPLDLRVHRILACTPCEQHSGLLEQLASRGREELALRLRLEPTGAQPSRRVGRKVGIPGVDRAARKDVGPTEKGKGGVATEEEHLEARLGLAHEHDGRGRCWSDRFVHRRAEAAESTGERGRFAGDRMRRIAIVGAGQAGLLLGLGLRRAGVATTLVTDRSGAEIRDGRILSTQCLFGDALAIERSLDLHEWEDACPTIDRIRYTVATPDGELALRLTGHLAAGAQSVDQRLKMPRWLERFTGEGGALSIQPVDLDVLEQLAATHDLVVVATGKGPFARQLGRIFPTVSADSPYHEPRRRLAVAYAHDLTPLDPGSTFSISIVPGVGEYFVGSALTHTGPCWTMCLEAFPGGPMDVFDDVTPDDPGDWFSRLVETLGRFLPWEAERCRGARATDSLATLGGAVTPVVRERVGQLPSGRRVLGIGDAVVLNDPLVGQGANCATRGASAVLQAILDRGREPLDPDWLEAAGAAYWEATRWSTAFTNLMLDAPPHVADVLGDAAARPLLADVLANGTNDPSTLFPWIADPAAARAFAATFLASTLERKDIE